MSKIKPSLFFAILIYFSSNLLCGSAKAQTIPPFKIMLSDNRVFSADELPKGKPLILVYFDPDCDHCQMLMKNLFSKIDEFKKAEIVMVTFKSIPELAAFEKEHDISKYPNIKTGTEGTSFYLRYYYGLEKMPFTALYDKHGKLNYSYKEQTSVDDLIRRLKKVE